MSRSRRAGLSRDELRYQPLYARLLGLQYLAPSGFLCFVFLEGAIALGLLLGLAELVSWWGVLVLPLTVAVMVKLNDVVAGLLVRPAPVRPAPVTRAAASPASPALAGSKTVRLSPSRIAEVGSPAVVGDPGQPPGDSSALNGLPVTRHWTEDLDDRQQRARQSAARRYE